MYFKKIYIFFLFQFFFLIILETFLSYFDVSNKIIKSKILDIDHQAFTQYADSHPIYGYALKKNIIVEEYEFNQLGFRSFEFNKKKNKDTYRIFVIGGSGTFGSNAGGNKYTYPDILNYILNKYTNKKFEVINAGVLGYSTWQSKIRIKEIFENYSPDMFIFMDGFVDSVRANDLSYDEIVKFSKASDNSLFNMTKVENKVIKYFENNFEIFKFIKAISTLYEKKYTNQGNEIIQSKSTYSFEDKIKAFNTYFNIEEYILFSKNHDIDLLFLQKPWIIHNEENFLKYFNNQKYIKSFLVNDFNKKDWYIKSYDYFIKETNYLCKKHEIDCLNLMNNYVNLNFEEMPQRFFSDTFHFTRYGNFIIAKKIYEFLKTNKKINGIEYKDISFSDNFINSLIKWKPNIGTFFLPEKNLIPLEFYQFDKDIIVNKDSLEGWGHISTNNIEKNIKIRLNNQIKEFFFYPRVFDDNSYVQVFEDGDLIFELSGKSNGLSGIANYYLVKREEYFRDIEIKFNNSQIWFKDSLSNILFNTH